MSSRPPLVLVTGIAAEVMTAVTAELCRDLPAAVRLDHRCDIDAPWQPRVLAALSRLRMPEQTIVVSLPPGVAAGEFEAVLAGDPSLSDELRVSSVVTALSGPSVVTDLLGERSPSAVAACAMVEYADAVVLAGDADPASFDLVVALARPDAVVVRASVHLPAGLLTSGRHDRSRSDRWADPRRFTARTADLPLLPSARVWRVDLAAPRPLHPGRLLDLLRASEGAPYRSRGCFWLPTRPGRALGWGGAGGQVAITQGGPWGRRAPYTRIVVTGVGSAPADLSQTFHELLTGPFELALHDWRIAEDGFEPWFGAIRVA